MTKVKVNEKWMSYCFALAISTNRLKPHGSYHDVSITKSDAAQRVLIPHTTSITAWDPSTDHLQHVLPYFCVSSISKSVDSFSGSVITVQRDNYHHFFVILRSLILSFFFCLLLQRSSFFFFFFFAWLLEQVWINDKNRKRKKNTAISKTTWKKIKVFFHLRNLKLGGGDLVQICRTKAESQSIVAQRPLSDLQYPVLYLSRLQRICLSRYLNLSFSIAWLPYSRLPSAVPMLWSWTIQKTAYTYSW